MEDSGDCVVAIQEHLKKQGVQGRKTSMAAVNQLERAKNIVNEVSPR